MKKAIAALAIGLTAVATPAFATSGGPDVSSYQGNVNWSKVSKGSVRTKTGTYQVKFAFTKSNQGTYVDPTFNKNWKGIKKSGIPVRGAYDFADFSRNPSSDAKFFVKTVKSAGKIGPGDLLVLDAESGSLSKKATVNWIKTWTKTVGQQSGLPQSRIAIYTGEWWWGPHTGNSKAFVKNPLWISGYGITPSITGWKWTFWQYTDHAGISGIGGGTDASIYQGSLSQLQKLAGL